MIEFERIEFKSRNQEDFYEKESAIITICIIRFSSAICTETSKCS